MQEVLRYATPSDTGQSAGVLTDDRFADDMMAALRISECVLASSSEFCGMLLCPMLLMYLLAGCSRTLSVPQAHIPA